MVRNFNPVAGNFTLSGRRSFDCSATALFQYIPNYSKCVFSYDQRFKQVSAWNIAMGEQMIISISRMS
jgi:hypothetical protein